ncbi:hypothetical protein FOPG_18635 [Fusarium oxysporum f. sp. conglutinans race 2 54008]|uniref:BED-type domain-containing protein n=1 Tax=Fusarium oxysporum f. sp. conglutinans race 2 54008 TaxID=1089457 RepID=X0GZ02_FUSOX|nr:hypothetical protein FOPG_18635 [Fusarium oxysporum f. sp. conglutinans race 2 54008]
MDQVYPVLGGSQTRLARRRAFLGNFINIVGILFLPRIQMDANVSAKRQRTLDFDVSSVPLIDLDALPDDWEIFPWNKFPGFTTSERASRQTSWVWLHGYDIQDQTSPTKRKWVCRPCLQKPKPRISDFPSAGIQNIEKHLFREHKLVDESGKRQLALGTGLKKTPSRNIVEMLHLDTSDAKEQAVANALIQRFDRDHFQRLRLELVVDANVSFRQPEHCQLRHIFEYLNPSVAATNALHIPRVFVIALIPIFTIFFFFFFFLFIMLFHMDRTYRRPVLQCWT